MEFFTTSYGITVHVWDTKDEARKTIAGLLPGQTRQNKPALVLLHGYLETMYIFNELIDALKGSYRIITLDLPGHGLTDSAPADAEGRRVNTLSFCASVVAGVLDRCGIEKAWIAGHSMGGYIAQRFLAEQSERTLGVILLGSHPYPDAQEKAQDREREKNVIREGKLIALAAASIPRMYSEDNLRDCDEKIRETVELCETHDPEGICNSIDGLRLRPDQQPVLATPARPVMLVYGDHDNFLPLSRVDEMKAAFPQVRYVLVPGAGHNAFIEREEEVVKAICGFTTGNC